MGTAAQLLVAGEEVLLFLTDSSSEAGKFVLAAGPYSAFRLSGGAAYCGLAIDLKVSYKVEVQLRSRDSASAGPG